MILDPAAYALFRALSWFQLLPNPASLSRPPRDHGAPAPRRMVDMTAPPTNRILERRDVCSDVCTPRLALIFFFQIKACKERWDAPRTGAARWRSAAAQDQIKMKITLWPRFYEIGPVAQQNPVLLTPGLRHHSLLKDLTCIKGANAVY